VLTFKVWGILVCSIPVINYCSDMFLNWERRCMPIFKYGILYSERDPVEDMTFRDFFETIVCGAGVKEDILRQADFVPQGKHFSCENSLDDYLTCFKTP
jgi:hypothetical protein